MYKISANNVYTVLDLIEQFLDAIFFPIFSIHFGLRINWELLNWLSFRNVTRIAGLFYESDVLLVEAAESDFSVMIVGQKM